MPCEMNQDELAAYSGGAVESPRRREAIGQHLRECEECRRRVEALRRVDGVLRRLAAQPVPPAVAGRVLSRVMEQTQPVSQIMTLRDVAAFLRVSAEEVEEILDELPAFEFAGQIRVRRTKLIEWIQQRERTYVRESMQSQAARIMRGAWAKGAAS